MGGVSNRHHRTGLWVEGREFILIKASAYPLLAHAKAPHECGDGGVFFGKSPPEGGGRRFSVMDELNAAIPALISLPATEMAVFLGSMALAFGAFF